MEGLVIGRLLGFEAGRARIELPKELASEPVSARALAALTHADIGCEVVVARVEDGAAPVVLGAIRAHVGPLERTQRAPMRVDVDGQSVEITAERELVLRVGAASITLTRAGKILIRGEYVLSRSSGVNRIKGGSVQIN